MYHAHEPPAGLVRPRRGRSSGVVLVRVRRVLRSRLSTVDRWGVLALAATALLAVTTPAEAHPAPIARQRAAAIVARMTLDEKITELHGIRTSDHYRYVPGVDRLGIPPLLVTNGPAGVGPGDVTQPKATALPAPISLAATWDTAAARRYGDIEGAETADVGRTLLEAPDINIARVPQNGRTFEAYGEDPYLAGQLAASDVRGIQSHGVLANVKHFLGNNQEADRFTVNDAIDERTLHEIYLPAFQTAVADGHAASVMCAYPKVNGTFNCENPDTLGGILRGAWGFDGFVTSDFGAVHSTVPSALAGLDLEMPTGQYFGDDLAAAVRDGRVPMSVVDDKLVRRFTTMIEAGLFDRPATTSPIPQARDGEQARRLATEGTVLLKNDDAGTTPLLPLSAGALHSVAVIGPYGGAATTGGGGSSKVDPLYTVAPVDGIRAKLGGRATLSYTDGTDLDRAAAVARSADVAVVMVGETESEGHDRPGLALPGGQDALIGAVAAANPHTVVVVKSGGPVLMPWLASVPAVLEAWYPGEEDGDAVADVLFGDAEPGGRLPVTFPARESDVPANTPAQYPGVNGTATYSEGVFVGYRHYDDAGIAPLFPFGFGLSYTTFSYRDLSVRPQPDGQVAVSADVTNTGHRAGAEVDQLYVGDPSTPGVAEPPAQLHGFARVTLRPGETRRVSFTLDRRAFAYWDAAGHGWQVAGGGYRLLVGSSSRDVRLSASITLPGGPVPGP
jgi:beta-glucosidase